MSSSAVVLKHRNNSFWQTLVVLQSAVDALTISTKSNLKIGSRELGVGSRGRNILISTPTPTPSEKASPTEKAARTL
ncbi:MAG TPA: hypothetical protein DCP31_27355 [Cyanobacteria bacterium UBA8543]|nr:hypothetical protein [Cyanobacteria bacterium UBA8543]